MDTDEFGQKRKESQQITIPQCCKQNKAHQVCQNPKCNAFIFVCSNEECQCQKQHELCIKVSLKPLLKIVSRKRQKSENELCQLIEKITDDLIDQISQLREDILNRLNYLGLNQQQREFIKLMEKKDYGKITAQSIHDICSVAHIKETICLQNSIEYVKQCWEKDHKILEQILKNLQKSVINSFSRAPLLKEFKDFQSKIISVDQLKDLIDMFENKITEMNLLYRGSENKFSVNDFRKRCDQKQNTLCVVRTQAGKIIGGFTPIPWDTGNNSRYTNDPSMKTFIFSLTMKKKFVQRNGGSQATHNYINWGPRFGTDGMCDFAIGQNANNGSSNCYANICNLFLPADPEDDKNLDTIKQNFVGNGIKGTSKFKITQWEVYQLLFN